MYFTTTAILLLGAVGAAVAAPPLPGANVMQISPERAVNLTTELAARAAPSWAMEIFSGTSCGGFVGTVTLNQFGTFCLPVNVNVDSIDVVNTGGCSTTIFLDSSCTNDPQHDGGTSCFGYSDGSPIKSVVVAC
ncbi:hypothetical protein GQ53DRAFT_890474 [Thozetella sp. PMI_491]|nr:hypothetical protein GQ53DRAFT_890474 [Thozetella sp. PMI_491]